MSPTSSAVLAVPVAALACLMVLTALGSRHRGHGWAATVAAGLFFPLAWAGWYVHDRSPRNR